MASKTACTFVLSSLLTWQTEFVSSCSELMTCIASGRCGGDCRCVQCGRCLWSVAWSVVGTMRIVHLQCFCLWNRLYVQVHIDAGIAHFNVTPDQLHFARTLTNSNEHSFDERGPNDGWCRTVISVIQCGCAKYITKRTYFGVVHGKFECSLWVLLLSGMWNFGRGDTPQWMPGRHT